MEALDVYRSPDWDRRARDSKPGPCLLAGCLLSAPDRLKQGGHQKRTQSYRQDKHVFGPPRWLSWLGV